MRGRGIWFCAILVFPSTVLGSEPERRPLTGYIHTTWTPRDGLPGSAVRNLVQTPDGYIWLMTPAGLARFDGVRFTSFAEIPGVPPVIGRGLCLGTDGTIWAGLERGGVVELQNGTALFHKTGNGLIAGSVQMLLCGRDHSIWVVSSEGVSRFINGGWATFHLPKPEVEYTSLAEDREGTVAVVTVAGVFLKRAGDRDFIRDRELEGPAYGVFTDPNGELWVRTRSYSGPAPAGVPRKITTQSTIRIFFRDRQSGVWFNNGTAGVYLARQPADFSKLDGERAERLSSEAIECWLEDFEGNIWIGTENGLDRLSPSSFRVAQVPDDPRGKFGRYVYPARDGGLLLRPHGPNGSLYIAPGKDSAVWAGNLWMASSFEVPRPALPVPDPLPNVIVDAGKHGLIPVRVKGSRRPDDYPTIRYEPNERIFKPSYVIPLTTADYAREDFGLDIFARDRGGQIWMANVRGLFLVRPGNILPVPELEGKGIDTVACDSNGAVWAGGTAGLFGLIDGHWRHVTPTEGMFEGRVHAFYLARDGALWVLGGGVSRLKDGHFSSFQGNLPFQKVDSMIEDDDGTTWFSTIMGIFRITSEEWNAAVKDRHYQVKYRLFDERDGLTSLPPGDRFNAAKTGDGRLWFTLGDSVVWLDPHHIIENRIPPPVIIEGAVVDGKRVRTELGLKLPHDMRSLRIDYTALSFVVPERVRFKIKLEGFDTDWVDPGALRQAFYTYLEPGRYRFRVKASNDEGVWNEAGAGWEFSVLPAFYQTYWFIALLTGAGAAGLWTLHRLRLRSATRVVQDRYAERLAERTRIARELHDTLLQSLAGAALQLNAISKAIATMPDDVRKELDCIRQQMHDCFREARQKVWDLRSPMLEGRDLPAALRESLEKITRVTEGFRLTVTGEPRAFPPHVEEQLLRIGEESVTNALRHSGAGNIVVELRYETERLVLCVSDDGKGFDLDVARRRNGHWGLRNMQDRAKEIGAKWNIESGPGRGTKTETVVPVSNGENGK